MIIKTFCYTAFVLLLLISCDQEKKLPQNVENELEKIRAELAPDKRTSIFLVESEYRNGRWIISAESSVPETQAAVRNLIAENFEPDEVDFSFIMLPVAEFADTTHAIVRVSVAPLRRHPGHTEEMVDQVLMGMELKLLKTTGFWYQIQTPYNYIGWITGVSIQRMDGGAYREWQQSEKVSVSENFIQVFAEPSDKSQVISDAVLGVVFEKGVTKGQWTEVFFPDDRSGFVLTNNLRSYKSANNKPDLNGDELIARAKQMLGIPYLWGGHSTKGLDCSGFTSTVFRTQGYQLPRDANMQAELGEEVIPDEDFSNIMPGDLIFFGPEGRITHTGICLGGSYYIHESGDVHISSLQPGDPLYNPYRHRSFQYIKRIIRDQE